MTSCLAHASISEVALSIYIIPNLLYFLQLFGNIFYNNSDSPLSICEQFPTIEKYYYIKLYIFFIIYLHCHFSKIIQLNKLCVNNIFFIFRKNNIS